MSRITNRRWAMSAFGTASSAALSAADTVYSVTPLYHPSGLMMSIGGAIAGGARLAMATSLTPSTFWDEVAPLRRHRRLLHVDAAARHRRGARRSPGERHHPVRLFIGSGMPRGLWRRVQERFTPARVLEFYASTEAGAILVNLSGSEARRDGTPAARQRARCGSRPTTSSAGRLVLDADGFAQECAVDEVGMLLARVRPGDADGDRSRCAACSRRDDAWLLTGDLFRRDADGDYWRVDAVARRDPDRRAVRVFTAPIRDALGDSARRRPRGRLRGPGRPTGTRSRSPR